MTPSAAVPVASEAMIEMLLQADRLLTVDLVDQAQATYQRVADQDPRNAIAVVGLARCALAKGDDRGAYTLAARALAIDPENDMARRMEARMAEVLTYRGETLPDTAPRPVRARDAAPGRQRQPVVAAPAAGTLTMRVLVTGGAGYVGSVSVERLVEAGHEVTVLDTLVTGHREVVVRGATLVDGSVGDRDLLTRTLQRPGHRGRPALRRALAGRSVDGGPGALLPRERGRRHRAPGRAPRRRHRPHRVLVHGRGVRRARADPDRRVRCHATRQPLWSLQARLRGCHALVRRVRAALRGAALLQRGGRQRASMARTTSPRRISSRTCCAPP